MFLHLEALGLKLHLSLDKAEQTPPELPAPPIPSDVPQPMVVYPDPPRDPLGFRPVNGD